jgi:hypothetical protein
MGTSIYPWTNILSPKFTLSASPTMDVGEGREQDAKALQILAIGWLLPAIFALIGRIWTLNLQRPELTEVP